jgi:hypothetical protein
MGIMTPAKYAANDLRLEREAIEADRAAVDAAKAEVALAREAVAAKEAEASNLLRTTMARAEEIRVKYLAASSKLDAAAAERETVKAALRNAERAKAEAFAARVVADREVARFRDATASMEAALKAMEVVK